MSDAEARRRSNLKYRYAITIEQYETLFNFQGRRCPVCMRVPREGENFAVDHQHKPPYWIRGILCSSCNRFVIGRHTDPQVMARASDYLLNPPGKRLMPEHSVPHRPTKRKAKPRGSSADQG